MGLMPLSDAMFMLSESRDQPMHVGGLEIFDLPEGADETWLADLFARCTSVSDVAPLFRRRPHRSLRTLNQWTWITESDVDLSHHVRHSALPRPGRVRELLDLVSRLHATLLDRHRPLWEAHLIEGLEGRRFAVYTKMHHSLLDGVSALRLLQRTLSNNPEDLDTPVPWSSAAHPQRPARKEESGSEARSGSSRSGAGIALQSASEILAMGPLGIRLVDQALRREGMSLPGQAPRTILNTPVTSARRFAADSWPIEQIRVVAKGADATVNDVVLAMCSGALRSYLLDLDALPPISLTAMTPVSLRPRSEIADLDGAGGAAPGGNAVGAILCNLGTDQADPALRLETVRESMKAGKAALAGLSQTQMTLLSVALMTPLLIGSIPGIAELLPPAFNLIISNVPGPTEPLYWSGARLQGLYPLSIPFARQSLNITVTSYNGDVQFGLTGSRRNVPHLQRLLRHLDEELVGLSRAVG